MHLLGGKSDACAFEHSLPGTSRTATEHFRVTGGTERLVEDRRDGYEQLIHGFMRAETAFGNRVGNFDWRERWEAAARKSSLPRGPAAYSLAARKG
jgi:hypothetical protein